MTNRDNAGCYEPLDGDDFDPRSRPRSAWQGRLAVMASRGEVDGPRVDECRRALGWHRISGAIHAEVDRGTIEADAAAELVEHLTGVMA